TDIKDFMRELEALIKEHDVSADIGNFFDLNYKINVKEIHQLTKYLRLLHRILPMVTWQPIKTAPRDGSQFLIRTDRVGFAVVRHDPEDEYSKPNELNPAGLSLSVYD